ncbi:MAG: AMP-dependent synthetase [Acidobacteria bacterium]|nr:MAG: AMP-dependent synthetase [Acidobacteriota bacterium]REK02731.1 MAG: AMP-dependent synthetase [Acidobacteriota bacterium]REK13464.1 MAG: AMP-dependent synthetase [Acidobacteriota bacterium]REK41458.1 MAG: AMP-dependent synthetase [Acidobacteriota bacterium]
MTDTSSFEDQQVAWTPTGGVIARSQLKKFMDKIGARSWEDLYAHSIDDVETFTSEVLEFLRIEFEPSYKDLLDTTEGLEWSKWCVGGGLNITEMCLDRWDNDETRNRPAVIFEGEEGKEETVLYGELLRQVEWCAAGLKQNGIGKGDAVGIHLPMMVETVVALLAINRIGAIAVPVFSGYGVSAIETRLNAVKAKALFTCDGFPRRGKNVNAWKIAYEAVEKCPSLERVIIVNRLTDEPVFSSPDPKFIHYKSLIDLFGKKKPELGRAEKTSANDPLIILYTSGTTGRPKGIAHVHCGFPIKAAQDMAFGTDVGEGTRISWVTDIGWMMGPWLVYGALILGGTIVIYDGSPDFPEPDRMWDFCAKHRVEILGISPTLVRLLSTKGDDLPKKHDLSQLRAFASTGEPWNPGPWRWLFEKVGDSKLPIINYSGGTEISGGILMGNFLLPQKPGSFPAPCPGIAADILDEDGNSVGPGEVGELAIRDTWIGMARGFWQERKRYLETYWNRFEGIWVHGDFAMRDREGHWYILGRSDDTLKVAGKRVGPAEVESLLVADDRVTEAAVIGVPDEIKGTAMVAFCVLRNASGPPASSAPADELEASLKSVVAADMGKPLTPKRIHFVSALPKTRNAKVMRRVIRSAFLGEDPGDLSALENPDVVDEIGSLRS